MSSKDASKNFYASEAYRAKQSEITKTNWRIGKMDFLKKRRVRSCARHLCINTFRTTPSDPKIYCSHQCAAMVSNHNRVLSLATKTKIGRAMTGKKYPNRLKAPPKFSLCLNPECQKKFILRYWRPATNPIKYCSKKCAIKDIGSRTTSPKAARALAGIRPDISPTVYFYSRWEANYARLMNFLGVGWVHQPRTFKLTSQKYTPDFYLPKTDTYVEIKNFLSDYSKNRDSQFRKLYPKLKLTLILKDDYLLLQKKYASKIKRWEYNSSKLEQK